jgi:hypothetical protein
MDMLENYFRPGKIVESYGGKDRVISFDRGDGQQWSVTVEAVDSSDNRGPRSHSTMPSNKELVKAWKGKDAAPAEVSYKSTADDVSIEEIKGSQKRWDSAKLGTRVGWISGPSDFIAKFLLLQEVTVQFPSSFSQTVFHGLMKYWGRDGLHKHVQQVNIALPLRFVIPLGLNYSLEFMFRLNCTIRTNVKPPSRH